MRKLRDHALETGVEFGFEMVPITWNPDHKGIDDLLLSKMQRCREGAGTKRTESR